ncbi:hypothetical protein BC832DRAFT_538662 [Gaertneriomyces semiglobifer]|nr:hypothetical protein BC832DRAFT_538662 [Gaertneriomyces semiglobifer]
MPGRIGPRGCAFSAFSQSGQDALYGAPQGPNAPAQILSQDRKTLIDVLLAEAPSAKDTKSMKNADSLNPSEDDLLAIALGAPARRVLTRCDAIGPRTGWRDGYLSTRYGFIPPDPNASPTALLQSPGRVWSDLCSRLPGLVPRGNVRVRILDLPFIEGSPEVIPDQALWAACVCLGILASTWRYEEANDGREGIVNAATSPGTFLNAAGNLDEEPETRGLPRNIAIPLRTVCLRLGRPLPFLSQSDVSIYNYKLRDPTSVVPYPERAENMDLRWPVFKDRSEAMFLLCMAEVHGCFAPAVDIIACCQECVMERDNERLVYELVRLRQVIDQLPHIFHKISVNPSSGENFAHPVEWGQRYAKWSAPLSKRVPALSGLFLPLFQLMDVFLGRTKYDSFLGLESLHLRQWMPPAIRAFCAAIEQYYSVPDFVKASGDPRLVAVLEGLVESYTGERGFMGTHRYKVYGFLEVVAKTGRVETNGGAGSMDTAGRPWEQVHRTLSDSMLERLEPYRSATLTVAPHDMRGSFEECRFKACIHARTAIDRDPSRATCKVTIDLRDTGMTFQPGDRLAIMPLNPWLDVEQTAQILQLVDILDQSVPLQGSAPWMRFARHIGEVYRDKPLQLTVRDILRRGRLSPLSKEMVAWVHSQTRSASPRLHAILSSSTWPIMASIADLLHTIRPEVPDNVWNRAFPTTELSWLCPLISIEIPRTYSISSYSADEWMPGQLDITVARAAHRISELVNVAGDSSHLRLRPGVCSSFLNPHPTTRLPHPLIRGNDREEILVGLSRPLNFQLPASKAAPILMFAGGSGIAPFRGFWQARCHEESVGRNVLFLGVQSREKLVYYDELVEHVRDGKLELHVAFSRDTTGLVYDPYSREMRERPGTTPSYIDSKITEQGSTICDILMSTTIGGYGGYLYICGSVALYDTVMSALRRAIYACRATTAEATSKILDMAFAERRLMLDIFMTPRPVCESDFPIITPSQLAQCTGHRSSGESSRYWIGVHGRVYDVTEFLSIHPGGSLIVAASAGMDASRTFDEVAHTGNPEVSALLAKYFIGVLAPKPTFRNNIISDLYDTWYDYLRTCVENLTTLSFEVSALMDDERVWSAGGLINITGVRKFYQFQSRLLQNGFPTLFGSRLNELHLKLTFALLQSHATNQMVPDIVGNVSRALSSPPAVRTRNAIAQVGEFVEDTGSALAFEKGIISYAKSVTEIDIQFLEKIRGEICNGMDVFYKIRDRRGTVGDKHLTRSVALALLTCLERVSQRLQNFFTDLAARSPINPRLENNPARGFWGMVARRIRDGSFFLYTSDENVVEDGSASSKTRFIHRQSITVAQLVNQSVDSISASGVQSELKGETDFKPRRLADAHLQRGKMSRIGTSYDEAVNRNASKRMSTLLAMNWQGAVPVRNQSATAETKTRQKFAEGRGSQLFSVPMSPTGRIVSIGRAN